MPSDQWGAPEAVRVNEDHWLPQLFIRDGTLKVAMFEFEDGTALRYQKL